VAASTAAFAVAFAAVAVAFVAAVATVQQTTPPGTSVATTQHHQTQGT